METDVIAERLKNLIDMVTDFKIQNHEGHIGIMNRQDHTNGTVTEHEGKITDLQTQNIETLAYLKGMLRILTLVAFVTPCIVGAIFTLFLQNTRYQITQEIKTAIEENNNKQFSNYIK